MIPVFPKIFTVGDKYVEDLFKGPVEITEKVDGSQFVFGKIGGILYCRSKGKMLILDAVEKMFARAVDYAISIQDILPDDTVFYSEYLNKPKHNMLAYDRTPLNGLALFGVSKLDKKFLSSYPNLKGYADLLSIDVVPLVYCGDIENATEIHALLDRESFLGGPKIEGIVIKNYARDLLIGGFIIPLMSGKYVSEKYKEKHAGGWSKEHTGKGKWELFKDGFRTDARWEKAIQHLRDSGELESSPRDIGKLVKEIQRDVAEEEKENIKDFLWKQFGTEILRKAIAGFPEWYKERLLDSSFE